MKKHTTIQRMLSVLLISLFSIMNMSNLTFAATEITPETGDATLKLVSQLMIPKLVSVPGVKFDIAYSKLGTNEGVETPVKDDSQPNLKNLDGQNGDFSYVGYTTSGSEGASGYTTYLLKSDNILPAATDFSHAGEYVYKITETGSTNTNYDTYLTYSKAEYELHVFVENTTSGLRVAGCYVNMNKDIDGKDITPAKVDIDEQETLSYRSGAFTFDNYYLPTNEQFAISNKVAGSYANLNQGYSFSLKLTNPSNVSSSDKIKYYGVIVNGDTMKPVDTNLIEFTTGSNKTFMLKTGEKLVFVASDYAPSTSTAVTEADMKVLPGGLKYNASYLAFTGYQHKGTVTHGGTTEKTVTGELSAMLTMTKETYVDDGNNNCAFESNYREAVITGITNKMLPFVLIMVFAIIGIAINGVGRRRKAE